MKSRTVRLHRIGGPEVMQIDTVEVGEPGPGELRLTIEAIGLNRAEAAYRAGQYFEQPQLPARLGYEAAGIVEAIGPEVTGFAVGDAVSTLPGFSMNRYGVYAEHALVPAASVIKRPTGMSAVTSAAMWMAYLTAYGALVDIGNLQRGKAVLITAASSSVGLAAIQIANVVGAVPIALTRTAAKRAALLAAGAAHVIVTDEQNIAVETRRITAEHGAALAFDPIGGTKMVAALAEALAPGGMIILYGNLSGDAQNTVFPFGLAALRGLSVRAYLVFEIISNPARLAKAMEFINLHLATGALKPRIDRQFAFNDIVEAHRYLEANTQLGKLVVTLP